MAKESGAWRKNIVGVDLPRGERIFATNTTGSFLVAREAVRRMLKAATSRAGEGAKAAIFLLSDAASDITGPNPAGQRRG